MLSLSTGQRAGDSIADDVWRVLGPACNFRHASDAIMKDALHSPYLPVAGAVDGVSDVRRCLDISLLGCMTGELKCCCNHFQVSFLVLVKSTRRAT